MGGTDLQTAGAVMAGGDQATEVSGPGGSPGMARAAGPDGATAFRFSTDAFREHERIAAWREVFGRTLLHLDFFPRSRERFRAEAAIFRSPSLRMLRASTSAAGQGNSRSLIANDDVSFIWVLSSRAEASQLGRSEGLAAGDAVLMSHQDVGGIAFQGRSRYMAAALPKAIVAQLVPDLGARFVRPVPASNPAQRMLRRHLELAHADLVAGGPELRTAFFDHACDLLALALGATRDAAELARRRGLAAARMRAIKDDIRNGFHRPELSVHALAARHGVSARYVQRAFEESGLTFTRYLAEQRLAAAYDALRRRRSAATPISTIAYDCGFSDVSHFNRLFRRRFGCTPRDLRKTARRGGA
jgi:AraC-like DNA-binding protein